MMRIISVYVASKRKVNFISRIKIILGPEKYNKLVPKQLLVQADMLKQHRNGIFIQLCIKCKEDQMNQEQYLFKIGNGKNFVLSILLCEDDLDKNISLADYYAKSKGKLFIQQKLII